ncbi:secretory lipase-domain-containing protein [Absidia repens]|uniref:Secretory lipase-domain-containing protein n=1 Tax=Absidia repens TaxID=90262 RepID=A0A1X2IID5_9FUNG|nr:secretory lipase-domain-containing protein [Absidia repens]
MYRSVLVIFFFYLTWVGVFAHSVQLPSTDPFYVPEAGFENEPPGKILRSRILPKNSLASLSPSNPKNIRTIYQLLYRTNDGLNLPVASVTTLIIPEGANLSRVVSFATAEDSTSPDCAPSYTFQLEMNPKNVWAQSEALHMNAILDQGWCIMMTDYESPKGFFGVGAMEGHAILDGIRAVLSSEKLTRLRPNADVQMWGYSGGALATSWAAQLQASYAPELIILGTAIGGIPVDQNATFNLIQGSVWNVMTFSVFHSYEKQYPDVASYMNTILRPELRAKYEHISNFCLSTADLATIDTVSAHSQALDMRTYVTRPDYLNDPIVKRHLETNRVGQMDTPIMPIYMFVAEKDETVSYKDVLNLYTKWCSSGANIQFAKDRSATHTSLLRAAGPSVIRFLERVFDKADRDAGCHSITTDFTV